MEVYRKVSSKTSMVFDFVQVSGRLSHEAGGEDLGESRRHQEESGSGWLVSCPGPDHGKGRGDLDPSVGVTEGDDGRALVKCHAGCETEVVVSAWGLDMNDLFERRDGHGGGGSYTSSKTTSTGQPATLENYAAYVKLPVEFLKELGLREYRHLGEPAVSMPYLDETGEEVLLTRSRVSLTGKPKVKTRKGDKHRLYGLWKLEEARKAGYVWLVEGESRYADPLVSRRARGGHPRGERLEGGVGLGTRWHRPHLLRGRGRGGRGVLAQTRRHPGATGAPLPRRA